MEVLWDIWCSGISSTWVATIEQVVDGGIDISGSALGVIFIEMLFTFSTPSKSPLPPSNLQIIMILILCNILRNPQHHRTTINTSKGSYLSITSEFPTTLLTPNPNVGKG
jgi:hypothetical protein